MRLYHKHEWEPDRWDYDWGLSTSYVEYDESGTALRKLEVYANGNVLKYDHKHPRDPYGQLRQPTVAPEVFRTLPGQLVSQEEFEQAWSSHKRTIVDDNHAV
jgi:hypothetical protein